MATSNVFISYRRSDTAGHTGRLVDSLKSAFGAEINVFMDLEAIAPGEDFVEAIGKAVGGCKVLLVMIGKTWATAVDAAGKPRIADPNDYVHREVVAALQRGVLVVPVLVEGAVMPTADQLPADLARLARLNALELSDSRWHYDVQKLVDRLRQELGVSKRDLASVTPMHDTSASGGSMSSRRAKLGVLALLAVLLIGAGTWLKVQLTSREGASPSASGSYSEPEKHPRDSGADAAPQAGKSATDVEAATAQTGALRQRSQYVNLLAEENGGSLAIATREDTKYIITKNGYSSFAPGDYAVFAFKGERAATIDRFAILIPETSDQNVKEIELLYSVESPTAGFQSLGVIEAKNFLNAKTPFQEFKFPPVTARYIKLVPISNQTNDPALPTIVHQIQVWGVLR